MPPQTASLARVLALRLDLSDAVLATASALGTELPAALVGLRDEGLTEPGAGVKLAAVAAALLADIPAAALRSLHDTVARAMLAHGADPIPAAQQLRTARARGGDATAAYAAAGDRLRWRDPAAALAWYEDAIDAGIDGSTVAAGRAEAAGQLAPTDAGEFTRIVTWYRDGHTYQVLAVPRSGAQRQLRFTRDNDAIEVDLAGLAPADIDALMVTWPSQTLRTATLIDTPGIGSLSEQVSRRAWELLTADDEETTAEAVIYLIRHLHAGDLEFLRTFHDTEVSRPNPVNAIGVLSRADEIGVGRIDSMASARRIAARLANEPSVRRVVQTVVPVAGLLAETAVTLTEDEVAQLRRIAALGVREADELLLTPDRIVERMPELGLTSLEREALLRRLGLFGVRLASTLLRRGVGATATELARDLAERDR